MDRQLGRLWKPSQENWGSINVLQINSHGELNLTFELDRTLDLVLDFDLA